MRHIESNIIVPIESKSKGLSLYVSELLLTQIKNLIQGQWAINDFTYTSFSSFLRESLLAYQKGMKVSTTKITSPKREIRVRLKPELIAIYQSFPLMKRTYMINVILASYLERIRN